MVTYRSEIFWLSRYHPPIRPSTPTCKPVLDVTFTTCMATRTFREKKQRSWVFLRLNFDVYADMDNRERASRRDKLLFSLPSPFSVTQFYSWNVPALSESIWAFLSCTGFKAFVWYFFCLQHKDLVLRIGQKLFKLWEKSNTPSLNVSSRYFFQTRTGTFSSFQIKYFIRLVNDGVFNDFFNLCIINDKVNWTKKKCQ